MLASSRRLSLFAVLACISSAACDNPSKTDTTTSAVVPTSPATPAQSAAAVEQKPAAAAPNADARRTKLDSDMRQVIDALDASKPKPIETLSAADARKNPTPADAVKAAFSR